MNVSKPETCSVQASMLYLHFFLVVRSQGSGFRFDLRIRGIMNYSDYYEIMKLTGYILGFDMIEGARPEDDQTTLKLFQASWINKIVGQVRRHEIDRFILWDQPKQGETFLQVGGGTSQKIAKSCHSHFEILYLSREYYKNCIQEIFI